MKKNYLVLLSILCMFSLSSCGNFLDKTENKVEQTNIETTPTEENLITTDEQEKSLVSENDKNEEIDNSIITNDLQKVVVNTDEAIENKKKDISTKNSIELKKEYINNDILKLVSGNSKTIKEPLINSKNML